MAKRMIDCDLWTNPQIVNDFTAEDKYFWLYLLTNPHNNICGVCKISNKTIANEMGYSEDCIKNLLNRFITTHKLIDYDKENYEILIINWYKFNWSSSPKLKTYIEKVLPSIKTERFKRYITDLLKEIDEYGIDRVSMGYQYPSNTNTNSNSITKNSNKKINQTKKNKETSNYYKEIIDFLNEKINARYKYSSKATQEKIKARLNEGFTVEDFKNVISKKVDDWFNDEKMCRYLRPETLFGTKFESYLNEKKADKPKTKETYSKEQLSEVLVDPETWEL